MKRYSTVVIICFTALLLLTSPLFGGDSKKLVGSQSFSPPGPPPAAEIPSLQGTTWEGSVTLVENTGSSTSTTPTTSTISGVILTVSAQSGTVISGNIAGAITSANPLYFTGVINKYGPPFIHITAVDTSIRAEIMNEPESTTSTAAVMNVTGSDLSTGNTFFGQLTQQ